MSMSDEPESGIFTTEQDEQGFEPLPLMLNDGGIAIFDQVEFGVIHNCIAVKFLDGYLSVLDRDTALWRDIGNPSMKQVK
jgi:hypothetical protein